ncbi:MAG: radical SAM protein [Actinobacteria bacterium]|nr:radical SAM protein [Actinomycetota bacterium]MBW3642940.1 radical SAM protein [Actinomycetota bacterium]
MRWRDIDRDGPRNHGGATLFDSLGGAVERRAGEGQFLGMEFLHVEARTIINSLPARSRLPFRHTINAYRGCSHACSYCFARPSHHWLDLDIDEGFERQVVVKVNAVERLRAELAPRRWAGEPIAMGTNTDPYQRCEAIYGLTRGLIEVLVAAGNPFSVLTKSTLVVRDLELLADAARRTEVSINLSIGTLDPEVWRATEPGTPHPRRRLEVVERLREAGVRCGVLVAPVLPGLSDGVDQLDDVVAACVDAGASSISGGQLVYLKPGTRQVFLGHLARTHPHLVERYEAWYPGVYAPGDERRRVHRLLEDAIRRHRGTRVALSRNRATGAGPRRPVSRPSEPPSAQLELGL